MIALNVNNRGAKWTVGWPYQPATAEQRAQQPNRLYVLPDDEHDRLVAWWREAVHLPHGGAVTSRALLDAIDLAVRRMAPPVTFRLVRHSRVVREYEPPVRVAA